VYTYYFDRAIPWPDHPEFGAFHTGEVPYVFNNLKLLDRPWEPVDHTVANQMSDYWTNFAESGDPNGPNLPQWPKYNPDNATTMRIGAETGRMPIADPAKVEFWTEMITDSRP
jgi:para-nitrobenzyl esterase